MSEHDDVADVQFSPDVDHWGSIIVSAIRGMVREEVARALKEANDSAVRQLKRGPWVFDEVEAP